MNGSTGSTSDREARIREARQKKLVRRMSIAVFVVLAVGAAAWFLFKHASPGSGPGIMIPDQGREHVALGTPFNYNSNPPTSGPHFASPANWGVYDYEVADQIFIHNLEHGGIWISHRPSLSVDAVAELRAIVNEFSGSKLIMAPRSANDADIAVAAWTRLLGINLQEGVLVPDDIEAIRAFYRAHKNRGPEFVPDTMPGIYPNSVP